MVHDKFLKGKLKITPTLIHIDLDNTHGNLLTPSYGNQKIKKPFLDTIVWKLDRNFR